MRKHSGGKETETLADYRARYTQYRLDPNLQYLHQMVPSIHTWDDHEVQNDYSNQWSQKFTDPKAFLARRPAAYQAFYEFMPLKPAFSQPHGPNMRVSDPCDVGELTRVAVIEGREYSNRYRGRGHRAPPRPYQLHHADARPAVGFDLHEQILATNVGLQVHDRRRRTQRP